MSARRWWRVAGAFALLLAAGAKGAGAQAHAPIRAAVPLRTSGSARADSIYAAGDRAAATEAYRAILTRDPENSHATFRLAQLTRDPAERLALYRRYVGLEPRDPWGFMALGDALARQGRFADALRQYDAALHLAPAERDAVVGRARVLTRAGRLEEAAAAYDGWLANHPDDAEALRELGRARLRAGRPAAAINALAHAERVDSAPGLRLLLRQARAQAVPALEPTGGGSRDSDDDHTTRYGLRGDVAVRDGTRFGFVVERVRVADPTDVAHADRAAATLALRPTSTVRLDAAAGGVRLARLAAPFQELTTPVGSFRLRWRAPLGGPALDLSAQRVAVDASPLLVANHVLRNEVSLRGEIPAGPFRLRGAGRAADIEAGAERNTRTGFDAIAAVPIAEGAELSAQFHRQGYAHGTTAGYFAPSRVETVEAGTYFEVGDGQPFVLALDLGAGMQRLAEQASPPGPWRRALRMYGYAAVAIAPEARLQLEMEGYDAPLAGEAVTTSGAGWRYGSVAVSVRVEVP
jgi:predicted TPR repeat methyltransferase